MSSDRIVRSLTALSGASSSRVLNLAAIAVTRSEHSGLHGTPFFESLALNTSIILKHRLRANELDDFFARRAVATKVIIPFDRCDLKAGGRSFFIGQKGYVETLSEIGNYRDDQGIKRDIEALRLLDSIPSLDPFLVREHLRRNGFSPDGTYFNISSSDQLRMYETASAELSKLASMALGSEGLRQSASTSKLVTALLSSEVGERLDPLRLTLGMTPENFSEGIFSWRGFLYYKWSLNEFWPTLLKVLRDVKSIKPITRMDSETQAFLTKVKTAIVVGVKESSSAIQSIFAVYDNAYEDLVRKKDPKLFREFLLEAPSLFLDMGEKIGALSHVESFWRYRFPDGAPRTIDVEELTAIFQDFSNSLGTSVA
jgi:hypothetical protein